MNEDIGWKQRFSDYLKVLRLLEECIPENANSMSAKDTLALIKAFRLTEMLGWQLMWEYMHYNGISVQKHRRQTIRVAFNRELITHGQLWMDMIEARDAALHCYDEKVARRLALDILQFLPAFRELSERFTEYCEQAQ